MTNKNNRIGKINRGFVIRILIAVLVLAVLYQPGAQARQGSDTTSRAIVPSIVDSAKTSKESPGKYILSTDGKAKPDTSDYKMSKSPAKAVLLSFLFPGLGQLYNEKYWKAPIFMVGAGTLGYFIVWNNKHYGDYSDAYDKELKLNPQSLKLDSLKSWRDYHHDNRDLSAFFLLGVYVLSAVDAYTDAHLFDFNVGSVAVNISPCVGRDFVPSAGIRIKF